MIILQMKAAVPASIVVATSAVVIAVNSMSADSSANPMRAGACMNNSEVEQEIEARLEAVQTRSIGQNLIMDTLQLEGMNAVKITNDSLCARARDAYLNVFHSADSASRAAAAEAFPAVLLYRLTPNRMLIATDEEDGWRIYRRVLVDSNWVVASDYL
jgi:hypothetical protein